MTYAMSDLHGCSGLYRRMIERLPPREEDTLLILGDVIDRGEGSIVFTGTLGCICLDSMEEFYVR